MGETTIDLDTHRGELLVIKEMLKCKNLYKISVERSTSGRGLHIFLLCGKACLKCRRKFDDPKRYVADMTNRLPHQRDVIFRKKTLVFPAKKKVIVYEKPAYIHR